jgi:ABC-type multidrug transport system fused ATPase/permease subunit
MLDLMLRYASLELTMVSVERIQEFSTLPAGAPEITSIRPPPGWPTAGAVTVEDLTVRYADDLPDVLKGVSFAVAAGEKVGLVGASGSGKSTIALSLFRMVEARQGRILIDGLDIAQLGTQDLRSSLTIMCVGGCNQRIVDRHSLTPPRLTPRSPQDPSLVSGTLRSTLDLRGEHPDEALFDVLRRVHLLPSPEDGSRPHSPFRSLDTPVAQHGS